MNPIIQKIKTQKIVPLFYNDSYETSYNLAKILYESGIRVIEYTNRGEKALGNFKKLKEISVTEFPELSLGIGTVKNIEELNDYVEAGADFIITPVINEDLVKHSLDKNILLIPGCLTPSEVNIAFQNGIRMVKIFPADAVGKNYIKSIKPLFPGMDFMPTGGGKAEINDLNEWFADGAVAVGLGSALINDKISEEGLKSSVQKLLTELK